MMEKEELQARVETTESFSIKLEQILPWQDGQYAEVFLGIRDYDEISAKMSEEVKNSLLYHLGTHIQKHLKGQEMVCHVKKDEFLLLSCGSCFGENRSYYHHVRSYDRG